MALLKQLLEMSFSITFVALVACALYLYLERDRVPEDFRIVLRVSCVYLTTAAINYHYMRNFYAEGLAHDISKFPTSFRYVEWLLTTPLMLLKFPLILGIGPKGRGFMVRLVVLDLFMVMMGYAGEQSTGQTGRLAFFLLGCIAWFGILASLISALTALPERIGPAVHSGVRSMLLFVVVGWAIYPLGYFLPALGLPDEVRELVYNFADLFNKVGLCLVVYFTAKSAGAEREARAASEAEDAKQAAQGELAQAKFTAQSY